MTENPMVGIRFYYASGILFWGKRKTMEEKYKIGTISKLLGIPIQTLHYFEECGFVTPSKDSKSNYRYYDAWDVNFLLDSRYLRSFEFSNAEIEAVSYTHLSWLTFKMSLISSKVFNSRLTVRGLAPTLFLIISLMICESSFKSISMRSNEVIRSLSIL